MKEGVEGIGGSRREKKGEERSKRESGIIITIYNAFITVLVT